MILTAEEGNDAEKDAKIKALEQQVAELKASNKQLGQENEQLKRQSPSSPNPPTVNSDQIAKYKTKIASLEAEIQDLRSENDSNRDTMQNLESMNKDLRAAKVNLQQTLDQRVKEKGDLNQQLVEKDFLVINMKQEMCELKNTIDKLEIVMMPKKQQQNGDSQTESPKTNQIDGQQLVARIEALETHYKTKTLERISNLRAKNQELATEVETHSSNIELLNSNKKDMLTRCQLLEQEKEEQRQQSGRIKQSLIDSQMQIILAKGAADHYLQQRDSIICLIKENLLEFPGKLR